MKNNVFQKRSLIFALFLTFLAFYLFNQATASTPTNIQCQKWDDAFLTIFYGSLLGIILAVVGFGFVAGLLADRSWFLAKHPYLRIFLVALAVFALGTLVVIGGPLTGLWFLNIDRSYFYDCGNAKFDAPGIFGVIGKGVVVISIWPVLILLFVAGAGIGGVITLIVIEIIKSVWGLKAQAKG